MKTADEYKRITFDDEASFEVFFKKCYTPLCRTLIRIVGSADFAEDIAQDSFISLWERRNEGISSPKAYLYRMAINKAYAQSGKTKHFVDIDDTDDETDALPSAHTTEDSLNYRETEAALQEALNALPEACRTVFTMSRYDELSYREIADALNISVKTVENHISKALKILRQKIISVIIILIINLL